MKEENFYATHVNFDENDKEEAILYLKLWKHFLLKELCDFKFIKDTYIFRENFSGTKKTIALKVFVERKEDNN